MGPPHKPVVCTGTPGLTRRVWLSSALSFGILPGAGAAKGNLPRAKSLRDELAQALRRGHPLVVLVSLDGCPFCKLVRENYLSPLREQRGLPAVQVDMRSGIAILDFKGKTLTHSAMVQAWKVTLAPTVLFFGYGGLEVAPRLNGIGSADYYGTFLDQRLEQAQAAIRGG